MIVILNRRATPEEIKQASEYFKDYIKIVVDIEKEIIALGGKLHADAERVLIEKGSNQENIWGGGLDLKTKDIDSQAIINMRPNAGNDSMEILEPVIRNKFLEIARKLLE